jgi:hypothetical protein
MCRGLQSGMNKILSISLCNKLPIITLDVIRVQAALDLPRV